MPEIPGQRIDDRAVPSQACIFRCRGLQGELRSNCTILPTISYTHYLAISLPIELDWPFWIRSIHFIFLLQVVPSKFEMDIRKVAFRSLGNLDSALSFVHL